MASEFERALDAEFARMRYHDEGGREPTNPPPKKKPEPKFKLEGEPGSPERWAQAARLVGDPNIARSAVYDQVTGQLNDAIRAIQRAEELGGFYDQPTIDKFAAAARHLGAIGDPTLYAAFHEAIADTEAAEYLESAVQFGIDQDLSNQQDLAAAQEQHRLDQRQALLQREYDIVAQRHGETAVQAVDGMVRQAEEAFYSPALSDDQVRAMARATAEQVRANEAAERTVPVDAAITEAMIRVAPPASSYSDAERAQWEATMRDGVRETYERRLGDPDQSADRAIRSMIEDDRKAETGKGPYERALDEEFAKLYSHSRQGSPHLRRLADANAAEWEATHDESGRETTWTDGLGRESERRGR